MPIWLESCGRTSGHDGRVGKAPRRHAGGTDRGAEAAGHEIQQGNRPANRHDMAQT
jgi:hypothetical protein